VTLQWGRDSLIAEILKTMQTRTRDVVYHETLEAPSLEGNGHGDTVKVLMADQQLLRVGWPGSMPLRKAKRSASAPNRQ
jgi:hypothetical protein